MVQGSIALPGAVVMVNNDLSSAIQSRLETQLHISESITGEEFDVRFAADNDYVRNIRALRQRLLVVRDFRDINNREEMDIVLFFKQGMISVSKNCFGPPGQTFLLKNIYWGALCIYHTVIDRSCRTCKSCRYPSSCHDGYGVSPYYPAKYDPAYPQENHAYNQPYSSCVGCGKSCSPEPTYTLCREYWCNADGCIPQLDCRLVKA